MRYYEEHARNLDGKMSFTPEEVADGTMSRFVALLVEMGSEIHIRTGGYVYVVEYIQDTNAADGIQFVAINTNSQWIAEQTENK